MGGFDLVIEVEGGCVRTVYGNLKSKTLFNGDSRVCVRDFDNIKAGGRDDLAGVDLNKAEDAFLLW